MTLLKLVPLGDGPTITFTAAAPVQPGPSHPDDDPAYAGLSKRQSYDSSHRQHRNDQQDDEELFRHASLALLLDYIMRMFPPVSNTWSSLLPNDFTSSRLPV